MSSSRVDVSRWVTLIIVYQTSALFLYSVTFFNVPAHFQIIWSRKQNRPHLIVPAYSRCSSIGKLQLTFDFLHLLLFLFFYFYERIQTCSVQAGCDNKLKKTSQTLWKNTHLLRIWIIYLGIFKFVFSIGCFSVKMTFSTFFTHFRHFQFPFCWIRRDSRAFRKPTAFFLKLLGFFFSSSRLFCSWISRPFKVCGSTAFWGGQKVSQVSYCYLGGKQRHVEPSQSVSASMRCTLGRGERLFMPYTFDTSYVYDISGDEHREKKKTKRSCHRRTGGGVAFVTVLIGVQWKNVNICLCLVQHILFL